MTETPLAAEPALHEAVDELAWALESAYGTVTDVDSGPELDSDELIAVLGMVDEERFSRLMGGRSSVPGSGQWWSAACPGRTSSTGRWKIR